MVARTVARAKDRVYYYDPDGRLKSFLVNLTDLFPVDAFTRISAGRSAFRVDDLLELQERLDRRKRGKEGAGSCKYNYTSSVKINPPQSRSCVGVGVRFSPAVMRVHDRLSLWFL
jgi:hypothetical protein